MKEQFHFNQFHAEIEMNQSISSLENLSNELFYEIFDYLDGINLYQAFSNLNQHFQQLINAPCLLFKINSSKLSQPDTSINHWKQLMTSNKHQIYSINLEGSLYNEEFFTSVFLLNSSFNHLESLHLWNFDLRTLMSILVQLSCLPRLFSLILYIEDVPLNLTDIYQLVFKLPMLKYYKFLTFELDLPVSLPKANNQQVTQIENLDIDHYCHFHELINILSYTPQVRRLRFSDDSGGKFNSELFSSISLNNLTSLSIHSYSVTFDEWEMFIRQIQPQLKVLYFLTRSEDINYLDAHRWEQFIHQYLPQLENFSLRYYESVNRNERLPIFPFQSNQFLSKFWIKQKWLMEIEMEDEEILYSIGPSKKHWYEYSSMNITKSTRLSTSLMHDASSNEVLIKSIEHILSITQIYHLNIWTYQLDLKQLIRILNLLPEIDSLEIQSIKFNGQTDFSDEEHQMFSSVIMKNQITKIYLKKIKCIGEFAIFTILCPFMAYFKVNDINIQDILSYSLCILEHMNDKCNDRLRLLCFRFPLIDNPLIEFLQQIINDQKFSFNYVVKRVLDFIYIERK